MKQFSLSEYLKNPSRKVVTREGKPARIVCTDAKGKYPVVALITTEENFEIAHHFKEDGTYIDGAVNLSDLFFTTEKHEGWLNVYLVNDARTGCGFEAGAIYNTKEEALECKQSKCCFAGTSYIDTVHIEWEE